MASIDRTDTKRSYSNPLRIVTMWRKRPICGAWKICKFCCTLCSHTKNTSRIVLQFCTSPLCSIRMKYTGTRDDESVSLKRSSDSVSVVELAPIEEFERSIEHFSESTSPANAIKRDISRWRRPMCRFRRYKPVIKSTRTKTRMLERNVPTMFCPFNRTCLTSEDRE